MDAGRSVAVIEIVGMETLPLELAVDAALFRIPPPFLWMRDRNRDGDLVEMTHCAWPSQECAWECA